VGDSLPANPLSSHETDPRRLRDPAALTRALEHRTMRLLHSAAARLRHHAGEVHTEVYCCMRRAAKKIKRNRWGLPLGNTVLFPLICPSPSHPSLSPSLLISLYTHTMYYTPQARPTSSPRGTSASRTSSPSPPRTSRPWYVTPKHNTKP
jgi:hypothetical protein